MEVELVKVIANYGVGVVCLAVLISLHIYNVRVTLPKLSQESREEIANLVAAFREELAAERRQCHDDHSKLFDAVRENQNALTRILERQR